MASHEIKEKVREIQLVVFHLCGNEFAAEVASILEASRMLAITKIPEAPAFIEGVINLRGEVIPVVDLARRFGLRREGECPKTARILIAQGAGEILGLLVDEVPEVVRIPEESIQPPPELIQMGLKRDYVRGLARIKEHLVIVLDLDQVLAYQEVEAVKKSRTNGNR